MSSSMGCIGKAAINHGMSPVLVSSTCFACRQASTLSFQKSTKCCNRGATAYLQSWMLSVKKTWRLTGWLLLIHLLESLDSINLPKSMCADCSQRGPQITFRIFQIQVPHATKLQNDRKRQRGNTEA